MTISNEAIEAAYAAHLGHKSVRSPDNAKEAIRTALEAAAPIIRAECLEEAADAWGPTGTATWLRARAVAERADT